MQHVRAFTGAQPTDPAFHVYIGALRVARAVKVTIQAAPTAESRHASDAACKLALKVMRAPECAFVAVYQVDPTPDVSCRYGAPMGRMSRVLDSDGEDFSLFRASRVPLDSGGYDKGGAYWGQRPRGLSLYAVQDGMGNVAFVDARSNRDAIERAKES